VLTPFAAWLGKELHALRNFSIGHLSDRGELGTDSPVAQALGELDEALADMVSQKGVAGDGSSTYLLSKAEAKVAVEREFLHHIH
jgi:hypothetical protein